MADEFAFRSYVCYDTKRVILEYATQEDVDTFLSDFPKGMENFTLSGDTVHRLRIPPGIVHACITDVGLQHLELPDSLEMLVCTHNKLRSIELPSKIVMAELSHNILREIKFREPPTELITLVADHNRLKELDFPVPSTLEVVRLKGNPCMSIGEGIRRVMRANYDPCDPPI